MFAIFCRRRLSLSVPTNASIFAAQQFRACSSGVCGNASEKSFTVSYLINTCGLSSKDAISASKKIHFESPEKPDAALDLLREYGFTDALIPRIVNRWPNVLVASPVNTLLPKLKFFRSIGVPVPVLAQKLSMCPFVLAHSLENSIIPFYNDLKNLLQSDKRVVQVFRRSPRALGWSGGGGVPSKISLLRERGVPESSIVSLVMRKPTFLITHKDKLTALLNRIVEMGFDSSKPIFVQAIQVLLELTESNMKQKREVYRICGWSESEFDGAFLRYPLCMNISEKKVMANMDFLVNTMGCKPSGIAQYPVLLTYSLEKRMKPRCLVARVLNEKGLRNMGSMATILLRPEKEFLKNYIFKYEKDVPELLDIYRGKLSPPLKMDSSLDK